MTPALAAALDLPVEHGALVRGAQRRAARRSAPACEAGSETVEVAGEAYPRDGDIIVAVDKTPVAGFRDLDRAIAAHRAGEQVDLHIVRGGDDKVVQVRLLPRPPSFANCS